MMGEVFHTEVAARAAETGQQAAGTGRQQAEAGRLAAATRQQRAETGRQATATGQQAAGTGRQQAETGQQAAETGQHSAEAGRLATATGQQATATGQQAAGTGQHSAEAGRLAAGEGASTSRQIRSQAHTPVQNAPQKTDSLQAADGKPSSEAGAPASKTDWPAIGRDSLTAVDSLALERDSLARGSDSLSSGSDSLFFSPLDSIRLGWAPISAGPIDSTAIYWRDTTAEALFGRESCTLQPQQLERPIGDSFTDNAVFQGFVLLLAATYAMLLYRNLGDVRTLFNRISRDSASADRLAEEPGASGFARFLNITTAIGMLFMGVIVVKYGDTLMPPELGQALSHAAVLALSLLASLTWGVIILFQALVIRAAGAVTLTQPFIAQLALLRKSYFALAVLVTSPTLLLFALCPRGTGGAWFIIGALELIVTAVLYLRESLNLFISKKISILHWFLYLCTVEVFPISLLWLLVTR